MISRDNERDNVSFDGNTPLPTGVGIIVLQEEQLSSHLNVPPILPLETNSLFEECLNRIIVAAVKMIL
ncbi:UNVERIFIED_CONTAM: hypothetical protein Slati_0682300 [Sesamum latifolium]|uniref:Uncharacterized protein n=1 Tax=Sesamum latifolium TaxID=2727402 RepID=A0AAW2Y4Q3_9LAMI